MTGVLLDSVAVNLFDARSLLAAFGVAGIFAVLFAETGLLIGFFLPGDSLLFTAGLLSSSAVATPLPLSWVLLAAVCGALLGAQVGYLIGHRSGAALHDRARRPKIAAAMDRSRRLLDRYGCGRAIVLARFIPVVRTVLNPVVGALGVPARTFTPWQIVGGLVWTVGLVVAGFVLGGSVPGIDQYLLPVIGLIVIVSLIPLAVEILRSRRSGGDDKPPAGRRVLVVDPDPARRARMAALLQNAEDIEILGTASGAAVTRAILKALGADTPDVVLVAFEPRTTVGATATVLAGDPQIRIWAYADDAAYLDAEWVLPVGVAGVLSERALLDDLRAVLRAR